MCIIRKELFKYEQAASIDVYTYSKIYYTIGTMAHGGQPNVPYVTLTQVQGRYQINDTTCTVQGLEARGGYSGFNLNTDSWAYYSTPWYFTTTSSQQNVPIAGVPLEAGGLGAAVWGETNCYVKRGTQTWTISVECEEYFIGM